MKSYLSRLFLAVVCVLFAQVPGARADFISWTYSWSREPADVWSDNGRSWVELTPEETQTPSGSTDVIAINLRTHSTTPRANPDLFTARPYTMTLHISDDQSAQTRLGGSLTFSGFLSGQVSATSSLLSNTFKGPFVQTLVLGDYRYVATLNPLSPPGPPGSTRVGSISVRVAVITPEPGSMTLGAMGLFALLALRRRSSRLQREGCIPSETEGCKRKF